MIGKDSTLQDIGNRLGKKAGPVTRRAKAANAVAVNN